tara:strand:+ start:1356 stop:2336 length:981 start_codon:yes stop_codon:yes gene_type:complete
MDQVDTLLEGFSRKDRRSLAKAITILESLRDVDRELSRELLRRLCPPKKDTFRIGITGSPGVGKSTLIENLGLKFIENKFEICVLAVDPSSPRGGGSILGDKTRMPQLANNPKAYVRPSPTGNSLGGVAHRTHDVIQLCEAFGFDMILVETVGVGQTELAVSSMVDLFFLMLLPQAGDELQGIKKGVMECADVIFINKADVDPKGAQKLLSQCISASELFRPRWNHWKVPIIQGSALETDTLQKLIAHFNNFVELQKKNRTWQEQRQRQQLSWLRKTVRHQLLSLSLENPLYEEQIRIFESEFLQSNKNSEEVIEEILRLVGVNKL